MYSRTKSRWPLKKSKMGPLQFLLSLKSAKRDSTHGCQFAIICEKRAIHSWPKTNAAVLNRYCVCMYLPMYVPMYDACMYVCMYVHRYVPMYDAFMCVGTYVCTNVWCIYVCRYLCRYQCMMHLCMYLCMYQCMMHVSHWFLLYKDNEPFFTYIHMW
jgi:hypothetical protein